MPQNSANQSGPSQPSKPITQTQTNSDQNTQKKTSHTSSHAQTPGSNQVKRPQRNFFTAAEDYKLLYVYRQKKGVLSMTDMVQELSLNSNRSMEAIRDRLKKYIQNLSPEDQDKLKTANSKNPKHYVHWYYDSQTRTRAIEKIDPAPPGAQRSQQFQSHLISRDEINDGSYLQSARTEPAHAHKKLLQKRAHPDYEESETPNLTEKQIMNERISFDKDKFQESAELLPRLKNFKSNLSSEDPKHVQKSALILDQILAHFSSCFGFKYEKILEILNKDKDFKDSISIELLRKKMVEGA